MGKIGILGGMGPMATVDFVQKLVQSTPASCDQEHLPLLIYAVPQIPDRTANLMGQGDSPLADMQKGVDWLVEGGAQCIAIPCNTAHYWQPMLKVPDGVTLLHIADIVTKILKRSDCHKVGLLATDGTIKGKVYQKPLSEAGISTISIDVSQQSQVMNGIYEVKSGNIQSGAKLLEEQASELLSQGVQKVILACTEIPLALRTVNSELLPNTIDATSELAEACIDWYND